MTDELRTRAARRWLSAMGIALALASAGCSATPPTITSGPDPADARAGGPSASYTPVTAGTMNHQPVEPKTWRDMNDRVAPRTGRTP